MIVTEARGLRELGTQIFTTLGAPKANVEKQRAALAQ